MRTAMAALMLLVAPATFGQRLEKLDVLNDGYPRAFFFRDRGPAMVDLEIEGPEPAFIRGLTVHGATDAICRKFGNGLVLANPSMNPYEFDLAAIAPGARFRRIRGAEAQAPEINDGAEVGDTVTVPARDGLFLVRM